MPGLLNACCNVRAHAESEGCCVCHEEASTAALQHLVQHNRQGKTQLHFKQHVRERRTAFFVLFAGWTTHQLWQKQSPAPHLGTVLELKPILV
eukprot:1159674-Pelagomonas_calceolata.AAC.7